MVQERKGYLLLSRAYLDLYQPSLSPILQANVERGFVNRHLVWNSNDHCVSHVTGVKCVQGRLSSLCGKLSPQILELKAQIVHASWHVISVNLVK